MLAIEVMLAKATKSSAMMPMTGPAILVIQIVGSLSPSATAASRPTISPSAAAPKMPRMFGQKAVRSFLVRRARFPI
ncbi:hypothetical protein D9M70_493640 [compost metagenome]